MAPVPLCSFYQPPPDDVQHIVGGLPAGDFIIRELWGPSPRLTRSPFFCSDLRMPIRGEVPRSASIKAPVGAKGGKPAAVEIFPFPRA